MEYLLIIILQAIGCGFNVTQKVLELDKKFPDDSLKDVFDTFLKSDRVTLIASGLVLVLNLVTHFIIDNYAPEVRDTKIIIPIVDIAVSYIIASFVIALVLGYAGQWLIYKWLGRAADVLSKKAEDKIANG